MPGLPGSKCYYVHYVDCKTKFAILYLIYSKKYFILVNKRLDEWITEESLDTRKVHFPRKEGGSNTGVSTPKKQLIGGGGGGAVSIGSISRDSR